MNVGFLTFSLPFKWWNETNIAHNKIWSWMVTEIAKNRRDVEMYMLNSRKFICNRAMQKFRYYGNWNLPAKKMDKIILFCGPYMPGIEEGGLTYETLSILKDFEGEVIYITCDYLLQFPFETKRYPSPIKEWPSDSLTRNKRWTHILHGGFYHHYKTKRQREVIKYNVNRFIEVPLNMSGIPLNHRDYKMNPKPSVDLLYCGAFRKGRTKSFEKYFCSPEAANWTISSSKVEKFRALPGMKAKTMRPLGGKIWNIINKSWYQLIMGDKSDMGCVSTPLPTRFWEALGARVPILFDRETCGVWGEVRGGYVNGPEELAEEILQMKRKTISYRKSLFGWYEDMVGVSLDGEIDIYKKWKLKDWI